MRSTSQVFFDHLNLRADARLEEDLERNYSDEVLPKPYPVMGIQYRGRLCVLRDQRDLLLERAGITGLQRESRWFRGEAQTRSVLVMLQPAGAWALFGVALGELASRCASSSRCVRAALPSQPSQ